MINIRQSKFKHVFGKAAKKEDCYENLNMTKSNSESTYLAVNSKFLAFISEVGGGGVFTTGKQDINTGIITGHTAPVTDIAWCPFDDSIIASASEDCSIKIWKITEEGSAIGFENLFTLMGHQRKVLHIKWHFLVDGFLISSGADNKLILWNLDRNEPHQTLDLSLPVSSMSFNYSGDLLCIGSRESHVTILNLKEWKILKEGTCHESSKQVQVAFVDEDHFITTGFSRQSDRQLSLWKIDDLSKPLKSTDIDTSNGSFYPFFDYDTNILFLLAKLRKSNLNFDFCSGTKTLSIIQDIHSKVLYVDLGDTVVRYFEYDKSDCEVYYLNRYDSTEPQRGFNFLPKIGLNVKINEIMRFYKLTNKKMCEVVSFIVPRKSEMFQEDIYPDTFAPTPALSFEDWIACKEPKSIKFSMKDIYDKVVKPINSNAGNFSGFSNRHSSFIHGVNLNNSKSPDESSRVDELKLELEQTKELIKDLINRVSSIEKKLDSPSISRSVVELEGDP